MKCPFYLYKALTDKAIALTTPVLRTKALDSVKNTLKLNNYPKKLVNQIIAKRVDCFYNNCKEKNENLNRYISVPYVKGLGENLEKCLKKYNYSLAFKVNNKIKSKLFSKLKYKIDKNDRRNVVYEIKCKRCSSSYIGQTTQNLKKRMYGHKHSVKMKNINASGLVKHAVDNRHSFNFENVKIIDTVPKLGERLVAESL